MSNLEELTEKIKTRLSEQNQILKDCVSKYQNSQKQNRQIADSISNITKQLQDATVHLKTIEQNHSAFVSATAEKQQQYEEQKNNMKKQFETEKQTLEEEKKKAIQEESGKAESIKKELEQKAIEAKQQGIEEQKKIDEQLKAEAEQKHQEEITRKEQESQKQKEEITEFENKLKNANLEIEQERKKMEEQHKADLATANSNEEKIQKLTNQNNELNTQITNLNKDHEGKIKELADKAKIELEKAKSDSITALGQQKKEMEVIEKQKIEALQKKHEEDITRLKETMTSASSAAAAGEKAKLEEAEGKLKLCNEKFQAFETEYENNQQELNRIKQQFNSAETTATNALKENVDKLAAENAILQEQIRKMLGDDSSSSGQQQEQQLGNVAEKVAEIESREIERRDDESKGSDDAPPAPQSQFRAPSKAHIDEALVSKNLTQYMVKRLNNVNMVAKIFGGEANDQGIIGNHTYMELLTWMNDSNLNKTMRTRNYGKLNKKIFTLFIKSPFYANNGMEAMFNNSHNSWEHQMHKALAAFWATAGKQKIINYLNRPQEFITMRGNDPTFNEAMVKWEKEFKKDTGQQGGYKHGKRSNKRMKRSLKSKLTARKFSLKKRSKRKKKGKSKKRRKSIKIRI